MSLLNKKESDAGVNAAEEPKTAEQAVAEKPKTAEQAVAEEPKTAEQAPVNKKAARKEDAAARKTEKEAAAAAKKAEKEAAAAARKAQKEAAAAARKAEKETSAAAKKADKKPAKAEKKSAKAEKKSAAAASGKSKDKKKSAKGDREQWEDLIVDTEFESVVIPWDEQPAGSEGGKAAGANGSQDPEMGSDDVNEITENDDYYGDGDLVEEGRIKSDAGDGNDELDELLEDDRPRSRFGFLKYVAIAVVVVAVAVFAVFMFRTRLLQSQLDAGREHIEAEEYDEAVESFNQALRIYHNSADAYLGLAQAAIGRGSLTEAIRILEEGISVTGSTNLKKSRENIVDQVFATYVLNEYMINILPGEQAQLTMTHRSEDMGFTVSWECDNPEIGTVDRNGLVTAKKNGSATITAVVGNDEWGYRDVTASLVVGVIVTYLEEKGCDFVQDASALSAPCFIYQLDKDGYRIYDGTLEIEQGMATYSLTDCRVSDPDVEGNKTFDITYTITVPTKFGIVAGSRESKYAWYYNWMANDMLLCDEYTGLILGVKDLYGSEDLIYDSTVTWNGTDYHVTGTFEEEWVNNEEWAITFSPITQITWAEAPVVGTVRLHVRVPKEYDGLALALDKAGITDYVDPMIDGEADEDVNVEDYDSTRAYEDSFFFEPLEDGTVKTPDDYYIIRLEDFTGQTE